MARIFISYKRVDKNKVYDLKNQIEAQTGEKCWIDLDGIESDAQFKNVIINAIKQCEVVLFMYSKAHAFITDFEKDWTVRELNFASAKNKRIVFINLDGTPLTDEFSFDYGLKQQVDGRSQEAVARLTSDLKKWLKSDTINATIGNPSTTLKTHEISDKGKGTNTKDEKTFNLSALGKKKYVVAISIIASVCLLLVPACFFYSSRSISNNEPNSSSKPHSTSPRPHETVPDKEQLAAINLGLPSETLWANMNVGAERASDFGDLFSWGEYEIKDSYTEYDYVKGVKNQKLGVINDAAYTILGAGWRTPSVDELQELIDNCKWTWTSRNGHNGYEVRGSNGNYIFLPASGWIHTDSIEYRNEYGYYWTSDRVNDMFAKGLLFSKTEKRLGNGYLWYGRCIRPVKPK